VATGPKLTFQVTSAAVPEPSALILIGTGLVGVAVVRWRKRERAN
jgi:hypothetical protein